MTAYEIANKWQLQYGEEPLQERIDWHKDFGLVFITKKLFILATEVYYNTKEEDLDMFTLHPNAWFIELAASSDKMTPIREIMRVLPTKREWVLWCRDGINKLHSYNWDKLARKVGL